MPDDFIDVRIRLKDANKFVADANKSGRAVGKIGDQSGKSAKQSAAASREAAKQSRTYRALAGAAKYGAIAVIGAGAIMAKKSIQTASDINESLTKNEVLFGKHAKGIEAFSQTSAQSFGISRQAALAYTGVFGNLFGSLGVTQEKSAGMSQDLVKLAADMASFNNMSIEDTLEAIRSGLVGETEPLRRFGVNMNDATLRAEALSMGLVKDTKSVLTPYQKAMAATALITKQTSAAHGDFERTSGGLANQQRILSAVWSDLQGKLGAALLPTVLDATKATAKFVGEMNKGTGSGGDFVKMLQSAWAALKPIGAATMTIIRFGAAHPEITRVALSIVAVTAAVKVLSVLSAASGLTGLVRMFRSTGTEANKAAGGARALRFALNPLGALVTTLGAAFLINKQQMSKMDREMHAGALEAIRLGKATDANLPGLRATYFQMKRAADGGYKPAQAALKALNDVLRANPALARRAGLAADALSRNLRGVVKAGEGIPKIFDAMGRPLTGELKPRGPRGEIKDDPTATTRPPDSHGLGPRAAGGWLPGGRGRLAPFLGHGSEFVVTHPGQRQAVGAGMAHPALWDWLSRYQAHNSRTAGSTPAAGDSVTAGSRAIRPVTVPDLAPMGSVVAGQGGREVTIRVPVYLDRKKIAEAVGSHTEDKIARR